MELFEYTIYCLKINQYNLSFTLSIFFYLLGLESIFRICINIVH